MTAMESDSSLASKCLDLCQMLASQGQSFTFSVTIGSTFNFSMSTRSQESPASNAKAEVKKKSPSTRRRDARRRKEFLRRKSQVSTHDPTDVTLAGQDVQPVIAHKENTFKCDQSESNFKSENGLKIHTGKVHKNVNMQKEVLRSSHNGSVDISFPPVLDASREEEEYNWIAIGLCKNCPAELSGQYCCERSKQLCVRVEAGSECTTLTQLLNGFFSVICMLADPHSMSSSSNPSVA